ncbi:MAG: hypothetical protein R6V10_12175 [bacterium]
MAINSPYNRESSTPARSPISLPVVFLLSAVMLQIELVFPLVLLYLPDRSGATTIIAIVMLGLAVGGILYYRLHGRESADRMLRLALSLLPFAILLGFMVSVLVPGWPVRVIFLAVPFCLISMYLSRAFVDLAPARVYFVNLLGSAAGAGSVFAFHSMVGEENELMAGALVAALAALLIGGGKRTKALAIIAAVICGGGLAYNATTGRIDLAYLISADRVPESRRADALSYAFRAVKEPGAKRLGVSKNLVARVDAVLLPDYDVTTRFFEGGWEDIEDPAFRKDVRSTLSTPIKLYYMDHLWSNVAEPDMEFSDLPPYSLLEEPEVLVIGPGGGVDIARAAYHDASRIVAVEINPGVIELMEGPLYEASGGVYDQAHVLCMDGRTYVQISDEKFDLIHLAFADLYVPFRNSDIFMENYLYTREAFSQYFHHLKPGGLITVQKWVRSAAWNKDLFRIAATARSMLEHQGVKDPASHIFIVGMEGQPDQYLGYFLISKTPFTDEQVSSMVELVKPPLNVYHAPGRESVSSPFHEIVTAPDLDSHLESLPYDISPTTDDRPLFYLFDRSLVFHWAYFALFMAVLLLAVAAPLTYTLWKGRLLKTAGTWTGMAFFLAIGVGYMFLQTTLLQKINLFVGSPTLSLSLVITTFLILGGIGSRLSDRVPERARVAVIVLAGVLALVYFFGIDPLLAAASRPSLVARSLVSFAFLAPLCLALGLPFPQGLNKTKTATSPKSAAIFFAVNCAAGSFAVAAFNLLLPMAGIHNIMLMGAVLYFVAAVSFPFLGMKSGT